MTIGVSNGPSLLAMFAAEAAIHLGRMEAGVASLGQGDDGAVLDALLDALHTLAGAARSVEQFEFEYLCRALERVVGGACAAGAAPLPREAINAALALAPQLIGQPNGRIRNQALALCGQLDALSTRSTQPQPRP